ncbi:MAG: CotH kinase family protein [Defluviitaleaceae bacterium]|nr:CotH kinase family protein [Defluviitaleaceae bacterium]
MDKSLIKRGAVLAAVLVLAVAAALMLYGRGGNGAPDDGENTAWVMPDLLPLENPPQTAVPVGVRDFPALHLTTTYDPFAVDRQFWHDAYLLISGTNHAYLMNATPVRLRGRGNSTWLHGEEKRPLRLRFETPVSLLGSPAVAQDWVLIANLFDMSLMRTHLAFHMGGALGTFPWTPFSRLVHVYINGEYQGVFQLADERDNNPARANLTFNTDPALSEFLLEIDGSAASRDRRLAEGEVENVDFTFVNGWVIDVRYPRLNRRDGHLEYLQAYLYRVDAAIKAHDFDALAALVDIPSLVDFYLVQEWFKNIDGGDRSIFMQLMGTGEARRLYFGPLWDFDRSAGNLAFWNTPEYIFIGNYNRWFADLMATDAFRTLVAARWREIRYNQVMQTLAYAAHLLENYEAAFDRNFERHDHIFAPDGRESGTEPTWFWLVPEVVQELHSFRAQVEYMTAWLYARAIWLDGYFEQGA